MKFAIIVVLFAVALGTQASVVPLGPLLIAGGPVPTGTVAIQAPLTSVPIQLVTSQAVASPTLITVPQLVTLSAAKAT